MAAYGFRRIAFLNGNGDNESAISQVGARLVSELGLEVDVASTSYLGCRRGRVIRTEP